VFVNGIIHIFLRPMGVDTAWWSGAVAPKNCTMSSPGGQAEFFGNIHIKKAPARSEIVIRTHLGVNVFALPTLEHLP